MNFRDAKINQLQGFEKYQALKKRESQCGTMSVLDLKWQVPCANPHSTTKLTGGPWVSHYLLPEPTSQGCFRDKKEGMYHLISLERQDINAGVYVV